MDKLKRFAAILTINCFLMTHMIPSWAAPSFNPKTCNQTKKDVCIDAAPCKNVGGVTACLAGITGPEGSVNLPQTCWDYSAEFTCQDAASFDTCQELVAQGCQQIGSKCEADATGQLMLAANGSCTTFDQTYQCVVTPAQSKQVTDCSGATVCDGNGNCWAKPGSQDNSFGQAVGLMETVREASVYQMTDGQIFKGDAETCTQGFVGLKNCCKAKSGAKSNGNVLSNGAGSAAMSVAAWGGKNAANMGSQYMYDMMFPGGAWSSQWVGDGIGAAAQQVDALSFNLSPTDFASNLSVSAYGFSYGASAAEGIAAGESIAGAGTLGSDLYSLGGGFAFDPTSLAISIAIQVVMSMLQCTQDEAMFAMHNGANLCSYVGSYCSIKIPVIGTCIETTSAFCCYNSVLSKVINQQGRAQLGMGSGSAKAPDCSGFSVAQLQALDFTRIDLSEFTSSIQANLPNQSAVQSNITSKVQGITVNKPKF